MEFVASTIDQLFQMKSIILDDLFLFCVDTSTASSNLLCLWKETWTVATESRRSLNCIRVLHLRAMATGNKVSYRGAELQSTAKDQALLDLWKVGLSENLPSIQLDFWFNSCINVHYFLFAQK